MSFISNYNYLGYAITVRKVESTYTRQESAALYSENNKGAKGYTKVLENLLSNSFIYKPHRRHKRRHN